MLSDIELLALIAALLESGDRSRTSTAYPINTYMNRAADILTVAKSKAQSLEIPPA